MVQFTMRIVTRPDFDGVVGAVLLKDVLDISTPVKWIEPYELREGYDIIKMGDIIVNLPYVEGCYLWFDHHYSNQIDKPFNGLFKMSPSAAGVVYEYYNNKFSRDFSELVSETDKIDSANYSIDEVLHPEKYPYIMLDFTISGRNKADEFYWNKVIGLLGKCNIETVLTDHDVQKKCNIFIEENKKYMNYLKKYTTNHSGITVTDFRTLEIEPMGNRFLVYSIFPESIGNVKIRYEKNNREKIIVSLGQNIFNSKGNVNLGYLVSKYGGGGHPGAGSCSFPAIGADEKIAEILKILSRNEKID